jgi:hypothetical protein
MIVSLAAVITATTWDSGLESNAIPWFEVVHSISYFDDNAGGFMAKNHGLGEDVITVTAALSAVEQVST